MKPHTRRILSSVVGFTYSLSSFFKFKLCNMVIELRRLLPPAMWFCVGCQRQGW